MDADVASLALPLGLGDYRVTTQRALWDAARLRRISERLHFLADLARDRRAREHLRYRAVEVWKQADALVPEERVR